MYLIRLILLCVLVINVKSKCTTTYITNCETVSDVQRFGTKTWENLIISPDVFIKSNVGTLNEVLKSNFFGNAKNIEELYIVDKISGIEPDAFQGLTELSYIKLYKNMLKVIHKGTFSNLLKLVKIDLQNNFIENIAHETFHHSAIKNINLSHNKLNNIQVNQVDLPGLEKLTVQHNQITYIAAGSFHENLVYLNLGHNSISQFEKGVLKPLKNLKELVLAHNRIKGIALNYGLPNLEILDLSHNEIVGVQDESFHQFSSLKSLKLNHNYITHLSHRVFPIVNEIDTLHLHYNALMYLSEPVAEILPKLEEITISGNPWACPCMEILAAYINKKNISQPDCDKRYFTVGKSAVCVVDEEECTGGETLTNTAFENFRNSLNVDLCSNL